MTGNRGAESLRGLRADGSVVAIHARGCTRGMPGVAENWMRGVRGWRKSGGRGEEGGRESLNVGTDTAL